MLTKKRATGASAVTNGSELLPGVDGRSPTARRYRDICAALAADRGGVQVITEARMQLIRRFAASACLAELIEAKIVSGEMIDLAEHALLSSTLVRLANHIGLERIPRDVAPYLSGVLDNEAREFWSPLQSRIEDGPVIEATTS